MKNLLVLVLLIVCAGWSPLSANTSVKEGLKGTWNYNVPTAPYDYSNGKIIFCEENGKDIVKVEFSDGTQLTARNVKIEKNNFSFEVQVESELVKVSGRADGDSMTGKASSSQGLMDLTAQKENQKNK